MTAAWRLRGEGRILLRWISLRHLREEPGRTLLTLFGVALGVAVFLAIRLANASALASFSATVDAVAGRANLQVSGGSGGFDERLFLRVRRLPGIKRRRRWSRSPRPHPI